MRDAQESDRRLVCERGTARVDEQDPLGDSRQCLMGSTEHDGVHRAAEEHVADAARGHAGEGETVIERRTDRVVAEREGDADPAPRAVDDPFAVDELLAVGGGASVPLSASTGAIVARASSTSGVPTSPQWRIASTPSKRRATFGCTPRQSTISPCVSLTARPDRWPRVVRTTAIAEECQVRQPLLASVGGGPSVGTKVTTDPRR